MPLSDLHHVALKTQDLAASEQFYTEVLGMEKVDRPDFDFPGAWLQMGQTMFHLMAGYAAQGPERRDLPRQRGRRPPGDKGAGF